MRKSYSTFPILIICFFYFSRHLGEETDFIRQFCFRKAKIIGASQTVYKVMTRLMWLQAHLLSSLPFLVYQVSLSLQPWWKHSQVDASFIGS